MLFHHMDVTEPDWKEKHVIILDNAPAHTPDAVKDVIQAAGVKVMYTAPASFSALPVEHLFGRLKA